MKENTNITLTYLNDGIARIKMNDPSNYNALSSKNINSLIKIRILTPNRYLAIFADDLGSLPFPAPKEITK